MLTPQQIEETLVKLTQQVATLHTDNESLRADKQSLRTGNDSLLREHNALNTQYLALSQSINTLVAERDALKQRVVELEAVNKKLTDMLWGRRSERRVGNSISPLLDFGDDPQGTAAAAEAALPAEIIMAQQAQQRAYDLAKLAELEARRQRRKSRRDESSTREEFPAHLPRREVKLDLTDEEKVGLEFFGTKIFERLRFEKPSVYIERIIRYLYLKKSAVDSSEPPIVAPPHTARNCRKLQV